jgi:hypothetical protein
MKQQTLRPRTWYPWVVLSLTLLTSVIAGAQTIVPPIAEYRGKIQGQFELRNDSDAPMAVILEAHSFTVHPDGSMAYEPVSADLQLEMGNTSFVIEPGGTHFVFYKAKARSKSAWFVITSTMTRAVPIRGQMRINLVLPHVVYLYQKERMKPQDVTVKLQSTESSTQTLEIVNNTDKLSRLALVECKGFEKETESGGVPIFPGGTRYIKIECGTPRSDAKLKVHFQDGFTLEAPRQP